MSFHVALTGARGFIGRNVVSSLLRAGATVTCILRSSDDAQPLVDWVGRDIGVGMDVGASASFRIVRIDLDVAGDFYRQAGRPDVLIHMAWGGLPNYGSSHHLDTELPLHAKFLKQAYRSGVEHIVVAGTCFEYGLAEGCLSEDSLILPVTAYATAKARLHDATLESASSVGGALSWLRLFYVYGVGQSLDSLYGQLQAAITRGESRFAMSPGDQTRDYLPVSQMGLLITEVSIRRPGTHQTLNICSGRPVSIHELVSSWIEVEGAAVELLRGELGYSRHEPKHAWGARERLDSLLKQPTVFSP